MYALLLFGLGTLSVLFVVLTPSRSARKYLWLAVAIGCWGGGLVLLRTPTASDSPPELISADESFVDRIRKPVADPSDPEYVGAETCRRCHADQFESWHDSYHRTMTQVASAESVLAPFDDITLASRGREFQLEQDGDEFWVEMPDPALEMQLGVRAAHGELTDDEVTEAVNRKRVRLPIVMTTGSHLHQTYWVPGPNGLLFQFPWVYHIQHERWVPRYDSFLSPPHADAFFNVWNVTCVLCHSTAGVPGPDESERMLHTEAELGIACEACHGPGQQHVDAHAGSGPVSLPPMDQRDADSTIVNPARLDHVRMSHVCAQCHSYFEESPAQYQAWLAHGKSYRPGDDLEDHVQLLRYDPEGHTDWIRELLKKKPDTFVHQYWPDGTARTGGREFSGLLESGCFLEGEMSCISCHSMHSSDPADQLADGMETNAACTQCHDEQRFTEDVSAHTHHPAESSGSLCYNCHMPHTTYVLMGAVRSHRIAQPEVVSGVRGARPNACNLCHLDKTLAWTQDQLADWHGTPRIELTEDEREVAAGLLWLLTGDATQRLMVAWSMGWEPSQVASGVDWQPPFLAELLADPYSAVRDIAHRSLTTLPGYTDVAFNFLKGEDHFRVVAEQVRDRWSEESTAPADSTLLISGQSEVDSSRVSELLQNRDDRPIQISE